MGRLSMMENSSSKSLASQRISYGYRADPALSQNPKILLQKDCHEFFLHHFRVS